MWVWVWVGVSVVVAVVENEDEESVFESTCLVQQQGRKQKGKALEARLTPRPCFKKIHPKCSDWWRSTENMTLIARMHPQNFQETLRTMFLPLDLRATEDDVTLATSRSVCFVSGEDANLSDMLLTML